MWIIAGNNLFNQWCTNDVIVTHFRDVPLRIPTEDLGTITKNTEIVEINWSYNIYKTNDSFYISGIWGGRKQFTKVVIPKEFNICEEHSLLVAGNDYSLLFVEKKLGKLWIMDENDGVKEIKFSEAPVDSSSKRRKENCDIRSVKAKGDNFMCLTYSGTVYIGMLPGLVNTENCLGSICDIDCGFEHFMLLTDAGRVYTWGNGRRLQLGHGDLDNLDTPTEVEALAGIRIVKICAGGWHSAALSEFGDLYVWGWNDIGQLGIRNNKGKEQTVSDILTTTMLPTVVDVFNDCNEEIVNLNVKDFACGSRHTAIILEDNSVWTSGCNKYGQLGFNPSLYSTVPYFKKAYECNINSKVLCGPWTTVLTTVT
ncbi:RCC1 domain-containing protein 1 [Plodia interpunctella]|uniref:RCC1 domain-containing protein 1 n=1 Tax=Plodia interpunctella TaxID=58824 RepID=UPI002367C561|nr:RCC1 domain-containing protein 1 [Plodia interpunctella]